MAANAKVTITWEDKQLVGLAQKAMTAGLRKAAQHGKKAIKAQLSGPAGSSPGTGPGKVSGELQRAVSYRVKQKAGRFSAMDVGVLRPNKYDKKFPGEAYAKALRLARGYVGRDRTGRIYSQRPRPFVDAVLAREKKTMANIVESTASTWMPKAKKGS